MEHEVFAEYVLESEHDRDGFDVNMVGCRTRHHYEKATPDFAGQHFMSSGRTRARYRSDPDDNAPFRASEDYYEWIDVLESVVQAGEAFAMIEIGAGYGRWIANAALAARRLRHRRTPDLRLVGVEADERRFRWMSEHLACNDVAPESLLLLQAGIADAGSLGLMKLGSVHDGYGEIVHAAPTPLLQGFVDQQVRQLYAAGTADPFQIVPVMPISEVIARTLAQWDASRIDLLDIDIQGAEMTAIPHSMAAINGCVRRMHIGTHSAEIDDALYDLLIENRWRVQRMFAHQSVVRGEFGRLRTIDGLISCINTRPA